MENERNPFEDQTGERRRLHFTNHVHHAGVNLTVRSGERWADLIPGELLDTYLDKPGGEAKYMKPVMVLHTVAFAVEFADYPEGWLHSYHDPKGRTRAGLGELLDRAYPGGWGPVITFVFYWWPTAVELADHGMPGLPWPLPIDTGEVPPELADEVADREAELSKAGPDLDPTASLAAVGEGAGATAYTHEGAEGCEGETTEKPSADAGLNDEEDTGSNSA